MIYFTSDQHYDHANIIKYCKRPFSGVDEMREEMIRRHNQVVRSQDIVWHLGDFSMHPNTVAKVLPRLNGSHYLVMGNHDRCHPVHYKKNMEKKARFEKIYLDAGFKKIMLHTFIYLTHEIGADMNHMPYAPPPDVEGYDQRFLDFRPKDNFYYLLHGHVHEKWRKNGKMINVGVDVWDFTPVSLPSIVALIRKGDHHNE